MDFKYKFSLLFAMLFAFINISAQEYTDKCLYQVNASNFEEAWGLWFMPGCYELFKACLSHITFKPDKQTSVRRSLFNENLPMDANPLFIDSYTAGYEIALGISDNFEEFFEIMQLLCMEPAKFFEWFCEAYNYADHFPHLEEALQLRACSMCTRWSKLIKNLRLDNKFYISFSKYYAFIDRRHMKNITERITVGQFLNIDYPKKYYRWGDIALLFQVYLLIDGDRQQVIKKFEDFNSQALALMQYNTFFVEGENLLPFPEV